MYHDVKELRIEKIVRNSNGKTLVLNDRTKVHMGRYAMRFVDLDIPNDEVFCTYEGDEDFIPWYARRHFALALDVHRFGPPQGTPSEKATMEEMREFSHAMEHAPKEDD